MTKRKPLADCYIGDPNSVAIMSEMDRWRPELRALVHEYGFKIVAEMINAAGGRSRVNAKALRADLEAWREREQIRLYGNV